MSDRHTPSKQRTALEELVRTATEVHRISHRTHEAWIALAAALDDARAVLTEPDETARKPDGYLIQYGDRVSAYAGSLDSNVFENLKADGIAHTVTPLFAIPTLGAAVWLPPKTNEPHSGGEPS